MSFIQQITATQEASNGASGTTRTFTLPATPATGNMLVLTIRIPSGRLITGVTDSRGNTWAVDVATAGGNQNVAIASCIPTVALITSDTVTITYSPTGALPLGWQLLEFNNMARLSADVAIGGTKNASTSQTISTTTVHAVDMLVSAFATGSDQGAGGITAPSSGWTEAPAGTVKNFLDSAYLEVLAPGAASAIWGNTISSNSAAAIAAYIEASGTLADAGSGDGILTVTARVPLTDTGTAVDSLSVNTGGTQVNLTDTGTGADTATVVAAVPVTDAGSGSDTATVSTAIPATDTGTSADALTVATVVSLSDTGTSADALTVATVVSLSDTGTSADSLSIGGSQSTVSVTDTGTSTDALSTAATVPATDTGTSADALTVATVVSLSDTSTSTDSMSTAVAAPVTDAGTAVDALMITAAVPVTDTGVGADALSVGGIPVAVSDAGTSTAALTVAASAAVTDSGHGVDSFTVTVFVPVADAGAATETVLVSAAVGLADALAAADSFLVRQLVALSDTGSFTDALVAVQGRDITVTWGRPTMRSLTTDVTMRDLRFTMAPT